MVKQYTADDMRKMANREKLKCSFVTRTLNGGVILDCTSDVRAMLLHAADLMEREEREKKYEYATKWDDGKIDGISPYKDEVTDSISFVEYISSISADGQTGCKLVRRAVGEWEEVSDDRM